MKGRLLSLVTLMAMASLAMAKPVDPAVAARVAAHVLHKQVVDATPVGFTGCYLFDGADGKGFALIAADDCVRPVLAYSEDGSFDPVGMPAHVAAWIDGYRHEIASVVASGITPSAKVSAEWEQWSVGTPAAKTSSVEPLLTTRWSQSPYYNHFSPYDSAQEAQCPTGCVATAMAQIMKYWEYPTTGWGSHSYTHPLFGELSALFDTTHYRWDLMPDSLTALSSEAEVNAVALLMYHIGVAVNMNYHHDGSGAIGISHGDLDFPCGENAFKTYFRYNPMAVRYDKDNYSDTEWDALLRAELDAGRPVFYGGVALNAGGHAFVLDGYDTLGMFHVNWGWGGVCDAFYTVDSLAPGAGSLGGEARFTFNFQNKAVMGIYPYTATDSPSTVNVISNDTALGTVTGNGVYQPYDTVNIQIHAAEGCRFVGMASGRRHMPHSFLALGQDFTDTAIFERIVSDTAGYCSHGPIDFLPGENCGIIEWGIRIPASMRQKRQIEAVQLFFFSDGDYTLNIWKGASIEGATSVYATTPVYSKTYSLQGEIGWRTLPLDSVLTLYRTETLWITFSKADTTGQDSPAAVAGYCGNSDGSWYHYDDGWGTLDSAGDFFTWMVRALFVPFHKLNVAASPNDINLGDVEGMGLYDPGDTVMLFARPKSGCEFVGWSNGSMANPLIFILTRDTGFVADFARIGGIDEVGSDGIRVAVSGLDVVVDNPDGLPLALYDVTGRQLATSKAAIFNFHFSNPGVYLLKADGYPAKRIVVIK